MGEERLDLYAKDVPERHRERASKVRKEFKKIKDKEDKDGHA